MAKIRTARSLVCVHRAKGAAEDVVNAAEARVACLLQKRDEDVRSFMANGDGAVTRAQMSVMEDNLGGKLDLLLEAHGLGKSATKHQLKSAADMARNAYMEHVRQEKAEKAAAKAQRQPKAKASSASPRPPAKQHMKRPAMPGAQEASEPDDPAADANPPFWCFPVPFLQIADGVYVVPHFMQQIGLDPAEAWNALQNLPRWPEDKKIVRDGNDPWVLPSSHESLNHDKQELKCKEFWGQTDYEAGHVLYGCTGGRSSMAGAAKRIEAVPAFEKVLHAVNDGLAKPANHILATCYDDGADHMGWHDDEMADLDPDAWILVLQLGAARDFEFGTSSKKPETLWGRQLPAGTAVFVNRVGNSLVKRRIPRSNLSEASGSLVMRCVKTIIPWEKVDAEIAKIPGCSFCGRMHAEADCEEAKGSDHSATDPLEEPSKRRRISQEPWDMPQAPMTPSFSVSARVVRATESDDELEGGDLD